MNKYEYLKCTEVQDFIFWLRKTLKNEEGFQFFHEYEAETKGKSARTIKWSCNSIYEAFENYDWPFNYKDIIDNKKIRGSSFHESELVLREFSELLSTAVEEHDHEKCFNVCVMILDWGGVLGSINYGNRQKLALLKPYICNYLEAIKIHFESTSLILKKNYEVQVNNKSIPIIMNLGFTKIYSLLCNEFIIYDGRVGAALGLLIRTYYEKNRPGQSISNNLLFHFGKAINSKVNRDPSTSIYEFKALSSSMSVHIEGNVKANWVIQALLKDECGKFSNLKNPSRCIEAALFMIGYRIQTHKCVE